MRMYNINYLYEKYFPIFKFDIFCILFFSNKFNLIFLIIPAFILIEILTRFMAITIILIAYKIILYLFLFLDFLTIIYEKKFILLHF